MLLLTKEELKSYQDAKVCNNYRRTILKKLSKSINYQKVRDHCYYTGKYRGGARSICNLKFIVPNEISVVFYSPCSSNYDYHFIIRKLANKFEGKFECLGENIETYKTFSVSIEKEVIKIGKDSNGSVVTISYKVKFMIVQDLWQLYY